MMQAKCLFGAFRTARISNLLLSLTETLQFNFNPLLCHQTWDMQLCNETNTEDDVICVILTVNIIVLSHVSATNDTFANSVCS